MRTSTLVGIAIALLAGLATVLVLQQGVPFENSAAHVKKPALEKSEPPLMVLVAKKDFAKGALVTAEDVARRAATKDELESIKSHKDKPLPAYPEAADRRVAAREVHADEILLKDTLIEPSQPAPLAKRLEPGMCPVSLALPKDRAAGGLLEVGEVVDVYLTTTISADSTGDDARTVTAPLARRLKIVVKNDALSDAPAAANDDMARYILQASPYRTALIGLARTKGLLSLLPSEAQPKGRASDGDAGTEKEREASFQAAGSTVSERDLELVFHLPPLDPAPTLRPRQAPAVVEQYRGVTQAAATGSDRSGKVVTETPTPPAPRRYRFFMPTEAGSPGTRQLPCLATSTGK